ncbi:Glutathione S-transferase [Pseudolycoriella hygida]|uniref:Glutathione S-transferase n=1 Tax=Pseudolycoriella hygida TaxID=35572 RepID=A0A9Q0N595_9DIPT|nr:Glutathione S-transferase [Pseudolycoriella hygida]
MADDVPNFRLVHYDFRALDEPIRWIFAYAGIPFVDEHDPKNPHVWLSDDNKKYESTKLFEKGREVELSRTQVISRYLASCLMLDTGSGDTWSTARGDEVICMVSELYKFWRTLCFTTVEEEKQKMLDLKEEGCRPLIPNGMSPSSDAEMYVGVTYAFPALKNHMLTVEGTPQIKEWIAKRNRPTV